MIIVILGAILGIVGYVCNFHPILIVLGITFVWFIWIYKTIEEKSYKKKYKKLEEEIEELEEEKNHYQSRCSFMADVHARQIGELKLQSDALFRKYQALKKEKEKGGFTYQSFWNQFNSKDPKDVIIRKLMERINYMENNQ